MECRPDNLCTDQDPLQPGRSVPSVGKRTERKRTQGKGARGRRAGGGEGRRRERAVSYTHLRAHETEADL
eukprot:3087744-Rhodomonas_salina.1